MTWIYRLGYVSERNDGNDGSCFFKYKIGKWIAYTVTQYHMIRWLYMLISNGIMGFNQHFRIDKIIQLFDRIIKLNQFDMGFVRDYWQPTAAAKLTYTCRRYHVLCTSEVAETNYITPSAINWTITYAPPWDTISIFFGFTKSKSVLGYELTVFLSEQKHARTEKYSRHTRTHTHPFSKRLYIKIHLSSINLSTAV